MSKFNRASQKKLKPQLRRKRETEGEMGSRKRKFEELTFDKERPIDPQDWKICLGKKGRDNEMEKLKRFAVCPESFFNRLKIIQATG